MRYGNEFGPITENHHLTEQEQRDLVETVANSNTFEHSPTLRAFFVYVAEHTLAGRLDEVKEQRIGCHVLGRKQDYDTANDNIVRIRARQVRQKLDEYFATEGRDSRWVISIPKGGYAPLFQPRLASASPTEPRPAEPHLSPEDVEQHREGSLVQLAQAVHMAPPAPSLREPPRSHFHRLLPWLIAAAASLALFFVLWRDIRQTTEVDPVEHMSLWSQFFSTPGKAVTLVVADSGFAVWQDVTHRRQSLADYVNRSFLREPEGNAAARNITSTPYTSLADVILAQKISQIANRYGGRVNVKHARNVDIHDFSVGDVVLLGSSQSDPWVELFEPNMSFTLARDAESKVEYFQNRTPKPGEPIAFRSTPIVGGRASEETYAVAAFMSNLAGTSHVLILEGIDMEGTEAAGEFVCNPANFSALLRAAGATPQSAIKPFEALIKLRAISGGYEALELAAFRYGTNPPRS